MAEIQLKRWGRRAKLCEFPTNLFCFTMEMYGNNKNDFLQTQRIRQLDKKYFSVVVKKNMQNQNKFVGNSQSFASPPPPTSSNEFSPLCMCCNIHHFGITKRKVMTSKLQVTVSKLQVTRSKLTSLTAETDKF